MRLATRCSAIRRFLPDRYDPRWSWSIPFPLGLSDYNAYGSESTRLPESNEGMHPVSVVVTRTVTNKLPGTVGTEDVAAAALLPQPTPLIAMRILLTNIPAIIFSISNVLLLMLPATFLSATPLAAELRSSVLRVVVPITLVQLLLLALTMLLAFVPILQAHSGLMHGIKYLAMVNSAGPFDEGYSGCGRRDCTKPHLAGLPHARSVRIRTADGETLGA